MVDMNIGEFFFSRMVGRKFYEVYMSFFLTRMLCCVEPLLRLVLRLVHDSETPRSSYVAGYRRDG